MGKGEGGGKVCEGGNLCSTLCHGTFTPLGREGSSSGEKLAQSTTGQFNPTHILPQKEIVKVISRRFKKRGWVGGSRAKAESALFLPSNRKGERNLANSKLRIPPPSPAFSLRPNSTHPSFPPFFALQPFASSGFSSGKKHI